LIAKIFQILFILQKEEQRPS